MGRRPFCRGACAERRRAGPSKIFTRRGVERGEPARDLREAVGRGVEGIMSSASLRSDLSVEGRAVAPMTEHDLLEVVEIEETTGLSQWGWDAYGAELSRPEAVM